MVGQQVSPSSGSPPRYAVARSRGRFARKRFSKLHTCKDPLKYRIGYMSGNVAKRCEVDRVRARRWLEDQTTKWLGLGCPYCGVPLSVFNFSVDHETPISRGGAKALENCRLVCKTCNLTKGDFTDAEFVRIMEFAASGGPDFKKHLMGKLRMGGIIFNRGRRRWAKKFGGK